MWINQSEHLCIGTVQKDSNLKLTFQRALDLVQLLSQHLEFEHSSTWGFLTMNPTLIGTGLKIYVHIKLAYLGTVLKKYEKGAVWESRIYIVSKKSKSDFLVFIVIYISDPI